MAKPKAMAAPGTGGRSGSGGKFGTLAEFTTPGRPPLEVETMGTNDEPTTDESNDEQQTDVSARAEYRPGEDVPLRVTLSVPEHVLDAAGGFEDLTDSVRLRPAPSGED